MLQLGVCRAPHFSVTCDASMIWKQRSSPRLELSILPLRSRPSVYRNYCTAFVGSYDSLLKHMTSREGARLGIHKELLFLPQRHCKVTGMTPRCRFWPSVTREACVLPCDEPLWMQGRFINFQGAVVARRCAAWFESPFEGGGSSSIWRKFSAALPRATVTACQKF
jgi:hypothetical protein